MAATATAVAISAASAITNAASKILIHNLRKQISLLGGLDEDAELLHVTLGITQSYMNDAETKSITQEAVIIWLKKLEDVAMEADNVMDEFSYHLLRDKAKKLKTSQNKILSCFPSLPSLNQIISRRNMAHTIKSINKDFDSMNKRATELGLQRTLVSAPAATADASFETDSFTVDPIFVGRDDDVVRLVDMITQDRRKEQILSVIAIVGMGGLGKTALTRKVFAHETIKNQYESLIWVHVSQKFDSITLFKKMLLILTSYAADEAERREVILQKLQEALKTQTYLLVLDDVWNEDEQKWENFISYLSGITGTKGNGIILTTRNTEMASMANTLHIHPLTGLSDEDCWSIIKAKAFKGGEVPSGFETIGRNIARRCHGLPLASGVVGSVLRGKSQQKWLSIQKNWLTDVEGNNISRSLKLSFDNLSSPSLKKCFAYCSIFPKGVKVKKQKLIELWMAEGILQPNRRRDMESVGDMFVSTLLQNSLMQVVERDDYGNVESCLMHDLVHDLAFSVLGPPNNADGIGRVRYMFCDFKDKSSPIPKEVAKHLRTLSLGGEISGTIFSDLDSLRVLFLVSSRVEELPNSIRKLIHLRKLDVSETSIENLPKWIGKLHHLQTLRADTGKLKKLPSTMKYLNNLRHLYINSGVELPAEIGRLTCLQTLTHFTVGDKGGCQIAELGTLNNLKGKLKICNLEKVRDKEEALKANISRKPNLFDLQFEWDASREGEINDESVLEGLKPHPNLKKLLICGFRGIRFPLWILKMAVRDEPQGSWIALNMLIEITLLRCEECEEIPMLDHLQNLKHLSLTGLKKVRFINSSFNHLTMLNIEDLEGLECLPDWLFRNNQNLSRLKISGCPKLIVLPDGLDTLNTLEELIILNCPNLKSIGNPSGRGKSHGMLCCLYIEWCGELVGLPREMVELWVPSLKTLELYNLSSLKNLPMLIDCLKKSTCLTRLLVRGVPNFKTTCGVESWPFGNLSLLSIDFSMESSTESGIAIEETMDGMLQGCCNSLRSLELKGMENWEWVPRSILHLTALNSLELKNFGVEEIPEWFGKLSSLEELSISSCKKLKRLPSKDALDRLTKLRHLSMNDCPELHIDSDWHMIPHLTIKVDGS